MSLEPNLILIIDDEPDIRELIEITLSRMSLPTISVGNVTDAKGMLKKHQFSLVLTDMKLPDGTGIELVEYIQFNAPQTPVAVITAFGSMDTAIAALKAGAFDFVSKPVELARLRELVDQAVRVRYSFDRTQDEAPFNIYGESEPIIKMKNKIKKLARSQAPVFISGESGSGKELVARMIHFFGPRREFPFVPINCGAIPNELMESEFFGHKKGSFTGATADKTGLFQAAHQGTLFLDEVADLPLHMQVKLLRAIQEKKIRPIGDQQERFVDIRLLSATHKDLHRLVETGFFRKDLFYRINVIQLNVPPLRDRRGDIAILAKHFLLRLAKDWRIDPPIIDDEAHTALEEYSFPGNVRELENILERALTLCEGSEISIEHLQLPDLSYSASQHATTLNPTALEKPETTKACVDALTINSSLSIELSKIGSLEAYLTSIEKQIILSALEATRWNRTAAAKKLGMSFRSFRYRLKKLGIEDNSKSESSF